MESAIDKEVRWGSVNCSGKVRFLETMKDKTTLMRREIGSIQWFDKLLCKKKG